MQGGHWPRALITAGRASDDSMAFMARCDIKIMICDENLCCPDLIALNEQNHIATWTYTVNSQGRLDNILQMGIKGIVTDFPNLLNKID